jgi:hypothetical protein
MHHIIFDPPGRSYGANETRHTHTHTHTNTHTHTHTHTLLSCRQQQRPCVRLRASVYQFFYKSLPILAGSMVEPQATSQVRWVEENFPGGLGQLPGWLGAASWAVGAA